MTTGLTLGQVFSRSMALYREAYKAVFLGIVLPVGLVVGVATFLMTFAGGRMVTNPIYIALYCAGLFLALAVTFVSLGALAHASFEHASGRPISIGDSWRQGLRIKVWGTMILSGIAVFLGTMCCLLPGIYLALIWSLVLPVLFNESLSPFAALSRSSELSRFNPQGDIGNDPRFRMFLLYAATLATTYLLSTLVQLPVMIAMFVSMARQTSEGLRPGEMPLIVQWLQIPASIASNMIQTSLSLLANLGAVIVYFDIRGRMDATDLEAGIASLGVQGE